MNEFLSSVLFQVAFRNGRSTEGWRISESRARKVSTRFCQKTREDESKMGENYSGEKSDEQSAARLAIDNETKTTTPGRLSESSCSSRRLVRTRILARNELVGKLTEHASRPHSQGVVYQRRPKLRLGALTAGIRSKCPERIVRKSPSEQKMHSRHF